jgi:hypothetical protein
MRRLTLISCILGFCIIWGKLASQTALPELCNTYDSVGLYNITIEFSKNSLSGLLILKKTSDSTFRLVLNAEMGPKLLDLELSPTGYKTIYAFKKLNRKRILRTFYEDFGALSGILVWNKSFSIDTSEVATSFSYDLGKQKKIIYCSEPANIRINSGKEVVGKSVNTIFYYFYDPSILGVSSMKLEHQHFQMAILLNKIIL